MVRFIGGGYSNSSRLMALDLMSPLGEVMASCSCRIFDFVHSSSSSRFFSSELSD